MRTSSRIQIVGSHARSWSGVRIARPAPGDPAMAHESGVGMDTLWLEVRHESGLSCYFCTCTIKGEYNRKAAVS
jgi:hypothetical protein